MQVSDPSVLGSARVAERAREKRVYSLAGKRVWVAGHQGMVGSAIIRRLEGKECQVLTVERSRLDLRGQACVLEWMTDHEPQAIFMAAAKVGGIVANNSRPVDFLVDNLAIQNAIIPAAHQLGVEKLLFLGSSCIYPRLAPQPIAEDALLTGPLEPTNEWYAVAKIAGLKAVQAYRRQYGSDFISAMPTNLYGPGDKYDLEASHVIPALIKKVHCAKLSGTPVEVWGSGAPQREFLYVDDCADACILLMETYSGEDHVNVGSGSDLSILDLTRLVMEVVDYSGEIVMDRTKPDGMMRKLLDTTLINKMGWNPKVSLKEGLRRTYAAYLTDAAPR